MAEDWHEFQMTNLSYFCWIFSKHKLEQARSYDLDLHRSRRSCLPPSSCYISQDPSRAVTLSLARFVALNTLGSFLARCLYLYCTMLYVEFLTADSWRFFQNCLWTTAIIWIEIETLTGFWLQLMTFINCPLRPHVIFLIQFYLHAEVLYSTFWRRIDRKKIELRQTKTNRQTSETNGQELYRTLNRYTARQTRLTCKPCK